MPEKRRPSAKAHAAELKRKLEAIRAEEAQIKERIYKLEACIVAQPGRVSGDRIRNWNTVPADEAPRPARRPRTRYQKQLVNRSRSRQALATLGMVAVAFLFGVWLVYELKRNGVL